MTTFLISVSQFVNRIKMKLLLAAAFLAVASALPAGPVQYKQGEPIPILRLENEGVQADGSYKFGFETANGIAQEEIGQLKQIPESQEPVNEVQGQIRYTSEDGTPIVLSYIANEKGFQPQGDHLPTSPPIPEAILRSLEYNAAHPEENEQGPIGKPQRY
ncbi:endocuticle structural glycoprotein SgAbd-2-like [Harmonia axyridis]|uniref:endocuticle structural glycoprotein SgAbd-2-like n=1 Tax=Harmonia axyridis TaxID=115357 RepID=UPI001E2764FD|nr:endocuticle structural glycoprotein SgAbd-2-like [Harmonia axyridis]